MIIVARFRQVRHDSVDGMAVDAAWVRVKITV
jgi:hypothetical protein